LCNEDFKDKSKNGLSIEFDNICIFIKSIKSFDLAKKLLEIKLLANSRLFKENKSKMGIFERVLNYFKKEIISWQKI